MQNYYSLNASLRSSHQPGDILAARARILSLYQSQEPASGTDGRRSFLKVFSRQSKQRKSLLNLTVNDSRKSSFILKLKGAGDKGPKDKNWGCDLKCLDTGALGKENSQENQARSWTKIHPRRKTKIQKCNQQVAAFSARTQKTDDVGRQHPTVRFLAKNETPVNYLIQLEREDPAADEDDMGNPFLNY